MPNAIQETNTPLKVASTARSIRFYQDDDDAIMALRKEIGDLSNVSAVELFRDCVHAGAPMVIERWKAMIAQSKKK